MTFVITPALIPRRLNFGGTRGLTSSSDSVLALLDLIRLGEVLGGIEEEEHRVPGWAVSPCESC